MTVYCLNENEIHKVKMYFEYEGFEIRNLKYLIDYLETHVYILSKEEAIVDKLKYTDKKFKQDISFDDTEYLQLSEDRYLNCNMVQNNIQKLIKYGFIIDINKRYKNFLEPTIEYMENLSEDIYVTVYISDSISDVEGGYYKVNGKIYYDDEDEEKFDYYSIKAWTRKQTREYYHRIKNHG